jgi:flagellar transcriptional activator FlhD
MNDHETVESIREVNLSYLMLAKHMLREDRAAGMFRLGLSAQVAELLSSLSPAQIVKLAACDQLLCAFRFDDHTMLGSLVAADRPRNVASLHTAVLLAGRPATAFA